MGKHEPYVCAIKPLVAGVPSVSAILTFEDPGAACGQIYVIVVDRIDGKMTGSISGKDPCW